MKADRFATAFVPGLVLAFSFALREMRGGLGGFYILIACIALGVAAIAGVNSVAASIAQGIAGEGQSILGGDVALGTQQQAIPAGPVALLKAKGVTSQSTSLRGMARLPDGSDQTLVEIKAVDEAYPLYGELRGVDGRVRLGGAGPAMIWADPLLIERFGLVAGSKIMIGAASFSLMGAILVEPDRLSDGAVLGPRVLMNHAGLERSGLVRPGSLFSAKAVVRLNDPSPQALAALLAELKNKFPDDGMRVQSRSNAAPALSRNIERFSQFLTLVGLTALVVGGVGVGNSVRAFLDSKRGVIATLKSLGAPANFIFQVYIIQILMLAVIGIAGGLVPGAAMPWLAGQMLGGLLPVAAAHTIHWQALGLAALYGLLTAFVFAMWPLALAQETPAASLFRSMGFAPGKLPAPVYWAMGLTGLGALAGLAIHFSQERQVAMVFLAAMVLAFAALRVVAFCFEWLARHAPRFGSSGMRMAVANIHRPGSLTSSVVLSLGLGLALIVALAQIDGSLRNQITGSLPKQAPSFFFLDVQSSEIEAFRDKLGEVAAEGNVNAVPMMRGRITHLKGIAAADYKATEGSWVLRGDRGITYSAEIPANARIAAGAWWSKDHAGEPLVSFSQEEANELGLGVGDSLIVNVLGKSITARIANLRTVEWENMSINFVMVFSPNTFAGAPHSWLATLSLPGGASQNTVRDNAIMRQLTTGFPGITTVRVRDAIDTINKLIGQLATAIRAVSAVALAASLLVLSGALAAGNRARTHDSVVLKTLGASRGTIIGSFVAEYALLGLATALFALAAGTAAAWFVVTQIMEFTAVFDPLTAVLVIIGALIVTIGLGLAGTWRILGQKAGPVLREL